MAISLVSVTPTSLNPVNGTGSNVTVTVPVNLLGTLAADDILLIAASAYNQDTLSITAGWSLVTSSVTATGSFYLWWKRTTGTETNPTVSGATNAVATQATAWRGCRPSGNPWQVLGSIAQSTTGTATVIPTAITTRAPSSMVALFYAVRDDALQGTLTFSNGTGYPTGAGCETTAGRDCGVGFASDIQATAGASGTTTVALDRVAPWQAVLLSFDPPIEVTESATPYDYVRGSLRYGLALPTESVSASDQVANTRVGGVSSVTLPTEIVTPSDQLRGPRVATTGIVTETATPSDEVATDAAAVTTTPYIKSLSASSITVGDSFIVNGAPSSTGVSETVTATTDAAGSFVTPGRDLAETATASEEIRALAVGADSITESATPDATVAIPGNERTRTPTIVSLSDSSITIGDSFVVNGSDGAWFFAETATASDAIGCTQVYAQTLAEAVTAADELLLGTQDLTRTPTITSLSSSSITAGDSFIVNGTTRRTATPSISLSANSITIGDSFTVNGSTSALTTASEWAVPTDIVGASQAFAVTLAEAVAAAEAMAFPATAIPIPATLDATEASSITGERDFADALLGAGEFVEWTVDAGGGGLFVLTALASSFEGAKVTLSIDDVDQVTTVIPSEEEEEGRY